MEDPGDRTPARTEPAGPEPAAPLGRRGPWAPWRTVVAFGLVSLAADMVYEGMRSVAGPFLASLGGSALLVGLVTGAGEAVALGLRLVTGPMADRTGRYWGLTWWGYALTAVSVPLLAVTPLLGAAGLGTASTLVLLERTGKAVRSPSKSALLARMTMTVGRGRGFGVHKALDQVGAFAGPLVVSAVAAATGHLAAGFAALAVPGLASMLLLARLRRHGPAELFEEEPVRSAPDTTGAGAAAPLPRAFHAVAAASALAMVGLATFGVISFHLDRAGLVATAAVPLVYAGAMAVEAVAALATGWSYDRRRARVLLVLPPLVACVPALVFADRLGTALLGVALWAVATGVQDSTVKAWVAELVPRRSLAGAYGTFAVYQGLGALAGGGLAGALYASHLGSLVILVVVAQALAAALLGVALRRSA